MAPISFYFKVVVTSLLAATSLANPLAELPNNETWSYPAINWSRGDPGFWGVNRTSRSTCWNDTQSPQILTANESTTLLLCFEQYRNWPKLPAWFPKKCGGKWWYRKPLYAYNNPQTCADSCEACITDQIKAGLGGVQCKNTLDDNDQKKKTAVGCLYGYY